MQEASPYRAWKRLPDLLLQAVYLAWQLHKQLSLKMSLQLMDEWEGQDCRRSRWHREVDIQARILIEAEVRVDEGEELHAEGITTKEEIVSDRIRRMLCCHFTNLPTPQSTIAHASLASLLRTTEQSTRSPTWSLGLRQTWMQQRP